MKYLKIKNRLLFKRMALQEGFVGNHILNNAKPEGLAINLIRRRRDTTEYSIGT